MEKKIITVRQATEADLHHIVDFNIALGLESEDYILDRAVVTEGVKGFISKPSRGRYFMAVIDGVVVGQTANTYEWSDWRNGEIWWIQSVYVLPEYRGMGIFRALFEHIQQLAKNDPECCGFRLYFEQENDIALYTYMRLGFEKTNYRVLEHLFSVTAC